MSLNIYIQEVTLVISIMLPCCGNVHVIINASYCAKKHIFDIFKKFWSQSKCASSVLYVQISNNSKKCILSTTYIVIYSAWINLHTILGLLVLANKKIRKKQGTKKKDVRNIWGLLYSGSLLGTPVFRVSSDFIFCANLIICIINMYAAS